MSTNFLKIIAVILALVFASSVPTFADQLKCPDAKSRCYLVTYPTAKWDLDNPNQLHDQVLSVLKEFEQAHSKMDEKVCEDTNFVNTEIFKKSAAENIRIERWSVESCGTRSTYRINFSPGSTGGTDFGISLSPLRLPPAPSGYTWVKILEDQSDRCAVLKPQGWFFRQEHHDDTDAYFITKEDIEKSGSFSTGLTLNVIYDVEKRAKLRPSKYVKRLISGLRKRADKVLYSSKRSQKPLYMRWLRIRTTKPSKEAVVSHFFYVGNDKTGTVWMYILEAPAEEWDEAWKVGKPITDSLPVDPFM